MIVETKGLRADLTGAVWRKSSRSSDSGNCVELAYVTACGSSGACVEVGVCRCGTSPVVAVRDSKDPAGPVLLFTVAEWAAFVAGARDGEFDLV